MYYCLSRRVYKPFISIVLSVGIVIGFLFLDAFFEFSLENYVESTKEFFNRPQSIISWIVVVWFNLIIEYLFNLFYAKMTKSNSYLFWGKIISIYGIQKVSNDQILAKMK
jgi:hypothetical protein